ncbi:hypothetical protein CHLRE_04g222850v5 [Chlamydomonas reinhardtii]|uniref:Uncharacterized protein n=1 Tax=Chlamydomonas reinhardtii TaxID=3055 RepID=A8ISZ5_CHLRE|nr:uncharacterized protein CHLRE_04g222850v5 [Chlamydomonas reinhardtii]PNW84143.1 hypothetical protein CHLRE_04g222850v5 [Chlamydomonas reinhardtii]|eukprot:XP_001692193.1 predicted protein [Chlamydomonas reinhardtii]
MSTPPKLQMSDFPQELFDEIEKKIETKIEKKIERMIDKKIEAKVREELQKQLPRDVVVEALGALYAFFMRTSSRAHAKQA